MSDKKELQGLFYRGVLETAEPAQAGVMKNDDTGKLMDYQGGVKLNFSTIVEVDKVVAGQKLTTRVKQNFVIKDECSDDEVSAKLSFWQSKEGKTLTLKLSSSKNFTAKLIEEV